jgi:hypothetical protein
MKLKRIKIISSISFLVIVIISLFFKDRQITYGLILGSILITSNFFVLETLIKKIIQTQRIKLIYIGLYLIKITVLFGGCFIIIKYLKINKLAFVIGLSSLIFSILLESCINLCLKNDQ